MSDIVHIDPLLDRLRAETAEWRVEQRARYLARRCGWRLRKRRARKKYTHAYQFFTAEGRCLSGRLITLNDAVRTVEAVMRCLAG